MAIGSGRDNEAPPPYSFIEHQNDVGSLDISSSRPNNNALTNIITTTKRAGPRRNAEEMATYTEQDTERMWRNLAIGLREIFRKCRS